jgi:hypothetical protein
MTTLVSTLRRASWRELRERIATGHPVDPAALEGWAYRGTTLGLPRVIERLSWQTFQKTFYREPVSGRLLGWNVRLHQDGLGAPSRPLVKRGVPVTTWHYEVLPPGDLATPRGFDRGLVIDYSRGHNPALDPIRFSKDPLVALEPGNADVLLGVTWVSLGPVRLETPTYFVLEREHRLDHVPEAVAGPGARGLFAFERRWAEVLFEAVLGTGGAEGLPALSAIDRRAFWKHLGAATPPYFAVGLRAAVHALTFLPLTMPGFRRPLFALPREARLACMARLGADERVVVKQALSTVKLLACFALFEDDGVRAQFGAGDGPPLAAPLATSGGVP